ncbi:MAG: hypothetical protein RBS73_11030 [Prolixibacteraceae bacterium]|jgi:hypothetical protein|nr:hypothetical protein [Prolixibacteraceae bacterium]
MDSKTTNSPELRLNKEKHAIKAIRRLEKEFIGRGEVSGFKFTQIKATNSAFLYKVESSGVIYYEVFKKRKNVRFGNVSYPTSKAFGKWAWTYRDIDKAIKKFDQLNS